MAFSFKKFDELQVSMYLLDPYLTNDYLQSIPSTTYMAICIPHNGPNRLKLKSTVYKACYINPQTTRNRLFNAILFAK